MTLKTRRSTRWRCPTCRRTFARPKQAHSCQVVPLSAHLAKASPDVRRIYDAIVRALKSLGPVAVVPTKSGINLLSGTSLGGLKIRRDGVSVGFLLTRRLDDPRVSWWMQISPRSVAHRVYVRSVDEIDSQLKAWLKEAYEVGRMAGRRSGV